MLLGGQIPLHSVRAPRCALDSNLEVCVWGGGWCTCETLHLNRFPEWSWCLYFSHFWTKKVLKISSWASLIVQYCLEMYEPIYTFKWDLKYISLKIRPYQQILFIETPASSPPLQCVCACVYVCSVYRDSLACIHCAPELFCSLPTSCVSLLFYWKNCEWLDVEKATHFFCPPLV